MVLLAGGLGDYQHRRFFLLLRALHQSDVPRRHALLTTNRSSLSPALQTALVVSLVGIIFIGVYPQPLIEIVQRLVAR